MADPTVAVAEAAPIPDPADIERAKRFTREAFVHADESPDEVLAPGSVRRRALDAALAELDDGAVKPSVRWRRDYSLLLGLERLLAEDEPRLVDGTLLSPHQVDALSGTLIALLAEAQRSNGNGNGNGSSNGDEHGNGAVATDAGAGDAAQAGDDAAADGDALDAPTGNGHAQLELAEGELLGSAEIPGEDDLAEQEDDGVEDAEEPQDWTEEDGEDEVASAEALDDPNANKRFWFEHATGAGKTVAAVGFVEASRTGGVLILTHRRNLVDQFHDELRTRGYAKRLSPALLGDKDPGNGPVTVETYQWFVRNAGNISDAYTIVICDEAHTALGEKTSACIRAWDGPVFIGMTATGALIARHVTDLFPTQTSRFDLAQAARRGVISPLRCIRIPPGPGVRTIAKVPLRRGEVDTEFDQEMLAELLDQTPFNLAIADLYKTRFNGVPGVVYAAGVAHAYNVADAFREAGIKAQAVSGETPKRELARILAAYERGEIDVLANAQLLAEGWNSPRATVCMHLAPTASKRIYQQRVGRVTRRHPGKEAGVVIDFVHPATTHEDPVVTLHSLLDRDVYRGGAIVVGPVRRGRGRRVRVERRVLPVTADPERRAEVFERELWRIAVEHLDYGEQHVWAALAGARVAPNGWRRAKAMLHFDRQGDLRRRFVITALQRNKNAQLRIRALQEIAAARDAEAFDEAIEIIGAWPRDEKREGVKIFLQALADKRIGRRDQANNWIWRLAEYTREVHEEYAVQRWPETKRLLGLLVNSSGQAHARNARRLVHAARKQDRRLSAAILAAALAHTPEAGEAINGARTRMARKPSSLARELLRNFPKGKRSRNRKRKKNKNAAANGEGAAANQQQQAQDAAVAAAAEDDAQAATTANDAGEGPESASTPAASANGRRRRRSRSRSADGAAANAEPSTGADADAADTSSQRGADEQPESSVSQAGADGDEAAGGAASAKPAKKKPPAKKPAAAKKPATAAKPAEAEGADAEGAATKTKSAAAKTKGATAKTKSAAAKTKGGTAKAKSVATKTKSATAKAKSAATKSAATKKPAAKKAATPRASADQDSETAAAAASASADD